MTRVATADTKLGDHQISKGTVVIMPFQGVHHNPEYYPDPEVFNPDRFSPQSKATRRQTLFNAFGNGPRICIGQRLALLETKLAMVHVLRKVRFLRCAETEVPLTFIPSPTLATKKPIMLAVELR